MKKVLNVLQSNQFSGAENVVIFISKELEDEYSFIYSSQKGPIQEVLDKYFLKHELMNTLNLKNLKKVVKSNKPDIIHAHDVRATILSAIVKKNQRLVSHMHVNNSNMRKLNIKTLLLLFISSRVDQFIWVSQSCYENYIFKKFIERKSIVLENVISENDVLQKLSEDTNSYNYDITFVGRLTYQKNPLKFLNICKKLKKSYPELKVALIGSGNLEEEVKNYIIDNDLSNTTYLGFVTNPLKIINDSKILVMTSRFEGTPMVALESLCLKKPIITTPVDGMKKLITNGYNGYLVNEDFEFVEKIGELVLNPRKLKIFGKNSKKVFDTICDTDKYINQIKNIYN